MSALGCVYINFLYVREVTNSTLCVMSLIIELNIYSYSGFSPFLMSLSYTTTNHAKDYHMPSIH